MDVIANMLLLEWSFRRGITQRQRISRIGCLHRGTRVRIIRRSRKYIHDLVIDLGYVADINRRVPQVVD